MKKLIYIIIAVAVVIFFWMRSPSFVKGPNSDVGLKYIVKETAISYSDNLPMIIAMHGNGDKMDNFYDTLLHDLDFPARVILLKGPLDYRQGNAWPYEPAEIEQYGKAIADAVTTLTSKFTTTGKPVLLGFSTGGQMAYYIAAQYPDAFSAIVPVSGRMIGSINEDDIPDSSTPVYAMHGSGDSIIGFGSGKQAAEQLKRIGREVSFTQLKGGHLTAFLDEHETFKKIVKEAVANN